MGSHPNIGLYKFPKQGADLGKIAKVIFDHDDNSLLFGSIVRDDIEEPFIGIIGLADGRYVLTTECQYSVGD